MQNLETALEVHDGARSGVHGVGRNQRIEHGRSAREISQTLFMLTMSGEIERTAASAPAQVRVKYLVETLNRMSAGYDSLRVDDRTSLDEMYEYLMFARWLELIPPSPDDPWPLPISATP